MGRVLIVNGNTSVRGEDRRHLTGAGFRVREADDIYSANDILYETEVDAVLLDVALESGRLFADVVPRLHPGIPVLLVGTFPAAETRGSGTRHDRRAGPADLLGKVATAVERRRARLEKVAPRPLPSPP
jgi:DNA-binding NtrC family response regulator